MKLKVKLALMAVAALPFVLTGCGTYPSYHGAYWMKDNTDTRYQPSNYEVLGVVTAQGNSSGVLGIVVKGEEGEGLLWEAAKEKYGDKVTGIKDISARGTFTDILGFVYWELKTTYTGVAVHEK